MGSPQVRGLAVGMVLGIVWMWLGFGPALLTAGLGLLGWLVGFAVSNLAARNIHPADLWNDLLGRRAET